MHENLDELERLLTEAPMLPLRHRQGPAATLIESASGLTIASLGYDVPGITRQHAALFCAAVNALPALLRVARAAIRFADLDTLPCDYIDLDPDADWRDSRPPCPGIERNGGPCHWCELRRALAETAEALEDYGHHTARCSWDRRMDAESVCDCGLEEAQRAARAARKGSEG